jgi:hypothetical protein
VIRRKFSVEMEIVVENDSEVDDETLSNDILDPGAARHARERHGHDHLLD